MIARLNHPAAQQHVCAADEAPSADPTGTAAIRRKYRALSNAAWLQFSNALRKLVVDQDFFGLGAPRGNAMMIRVLIEPDQQASAFEGWLRETVKRAVVFNTDAMLREARNHAIKRAMRLADTNVVTFISPEAANLRVVVAQDFESIKDVTITRLLRHMRNLQGEKTPVMLYSELAAIIDKIGMRRTHLLIETYVVEAHAHGTLDQFESAGIKDVGIIPERVHLISIGDAKRKRVKARKYSGPGSRIKKGETPSKSTLARIRRAQKKIEKLGRVNVLTAGDDDVCPECEAISEGGPYTINRARKLIPAHPRCRCAFIPADDARFSEIE